MKTINLYRKASHFNLGGVEARYLADLVNYVETTLDQHLVVVVPSSERTEERNHLFTVRVTDKRQGGGVYDLLIDVTHRGCEVLETKTILEPTPEEPKPAPKYTGPTTYKIVSENRMSGLTREDEVKVTRNPIVFGAGGKQMNPESRYVAGSQYGCSRDYETTSDETAIKNLLAEHGRVLKSIKKV